MWLESCIGQYGVKEHSAYATLEYCAKCGHVSENSESSYIEHILIGPQCVVIYLSL